LSAIRGSSSQDPRSIDIEDFALPQAPIRVALCADPGAGGVHRAIARAVSDVGRHLSDLGFAVDEIEPPRFEETADLWPEIAMPDYVAQMEPAISRCEDRNIRRSVALWRECWPQIDPAGSLSALAKRFELQRIWLNFLHTYPVLIMPTSKAPAFAWGEDIADC